MILIPEISLAPARRRQCRLGVRKDVLAGILLMLAGLMTALVQALLLIRPGFGIGLVGFALALAGGMLFLVRIGEVA